MKIDNLAIGEIVQWVITKTPVAYSRWGDGEWNSILGIGKVNHDKQPFAAVHADLVRVLRDRPSYFLGLQAFAIRRLGDRISEWLEKEKLAFNWRSGQTLAHADINGELGPFIAALKTRSVIMVGPAHLSTLKLFPIKQFVQVKSDGKAHESRGQVFKETLTAARALTEPVVLLSAGMTAKGLVHDLRAKLPNATLLDCGSLWEPYAGVASRSYHPMIIQRLSDEKH